LMGSLAPAGPQKKKIKERIRRVAMIPFPINLSRNI
jgi:hypothetical protein